MKISVLITTSILLCTLTTPNNAANESAGQNKLVKLYELKKTLNQEAINAFQAQGIDYSKLPYKITTAVEGKVDALCNQLSKHLRQQKKDEISLEIIQKDVLIALATLMPEATNTVSRKALPGAVDKFITELAQEKTVSIEKLPQKLKDNLFKRRAAMISNLNNDMQTHNRDFVYISNLEETGHKMLDLFMEQAKYVLISQWGQGALNALNSLKFVTNTQRFPIHQ